MATGAREDEREALEPAGRLEERTGFEHHPEQYSFNEVEELLERRDRPGFELSIKEWIGASKNQLIDDFIFGEVLRNIDEVEQVLDKFAAAELGSNADDAEIMRSIRRGDLYQRIMGVHHERERVGEDEAALNETIFDDKTEIGLAEGVEYFLRGEKHGKRLRPALNILTGYALFDSVNYLSTMVGAAMEGKHAPSLMKDDDMDDDDKRRGRGSIVAMNRVVHGSRTWPQSVLDADIVESWSRKAITSLVDNSELDRSLTPATEHLSHQLDQELSQGQKRDIEREDISLDDTDMDDYKNIIDQKTGALFRSGVEKLVGTYLDEESYADEEEERIRSLFNRYIDRFNFLFQAGDDNNELFEDEEQTGKSVSDVENRKKTFNTIIAKETLYEKGEEYGDLFVEVFDGAYDEVTEEMKERAEELGVSIEDTGEDWETEWLTDVMMQFEDAYDEAVEPYLREAYEAVEELHSMGVINEVARDRYQELAEFVWTRDS